MRKLAELIAVHGVARCERIGPVCGFGTLFEVIVQNVSLVCVCWLTDCFYSCVLVRACCLLERLTLPR